MSDFDKPSVRATLQGNSLLNALSSDELGRLVTTCRMVSAERGETLWSNGAETDFFGLASSGYVKMIRSYASGMDVALELVGPDQIFGLMGAVTGMGCPLSAVAATDLQYVRIPKAAFLEIYDHNPLLKDRLIRSMAQRLHRAIDFIARLSVGAVEERIAAVILLLAESFAVKQGEALRLGAPLTNRDIAELSGTTVEVAERTIERWRAAGIIARERQFLTILDRERLAEEVEVGIAPVANFARLAA